MASPPKVTLLIETARGYGRGVLRGIVRYGRLHGPWAFYLTPGDFKQAVPKLDSWGCTGIIARIEDPRIAKAVLAARLPLVALDLSEEQLRASGPLARLSELVSDSRGAAQMAAEHLLERGFRHYAFVGIPGRIWSQRREAGFVERITEAGFQPHVYPAPRLKRDRSWDSEQTLMSDWLRALPKPIGLMACNDDRGRQLLEACHTAGIPVPEEIAVVGVDNDELLCELADPPLSSVALNAERGGYEAAALLDKLMRGRLRKRQRIVVEPLHVITRRSSEITAFDDREVAGALRFIHDNASKMIQVSDVVEHFDVSRRTLELRFRQVVGRSICTEITRVRLERAKLLLAESNLPIPRVAESVGYGSDSHFCAAFRREIGMTPTRYRMSVKNSP